MHLSERSCTDPLVLESLLLCTGPPSNRPSGMDDCFFQPVKANWSLRSVRRARVSRYILCVRRPELSPNGRAFTCCFLLWLQNKGHVPTTYGQFCKAIGTPAEPLEAPTSIPGPGSEKKGIPIISVPTLTELGYNESDQVRRAAQGSCLRGPLSRSRNMGIK